MSACTDDDDDDVPSGLADLQGSWVGPCLVEDPEDDSSQQSEVVFEGDKLILSELYYILTTECDNELTLSLEGSATVSHDSMTTQVGPLVGKHLDLEFSTSASLSASSAVETLIEASGTSLQAYAAAAGISDINNVDLSEIGDNVSDTGTITEYNIYNVDGNVLRIGIETESRDGTVPAMRYNVFDPDTYTRKE